VRQLEEWVQQIHQSGVKKKKPKKAEKVDPQIRRYEEMLQESLNTPVRIRHGKRKGKIEIEYFSQSELERLLELLQRDPLIGGEAGTDAMAEEIARAFWKNGRKSGEPT